MKRSPVLISLSKEHHESLVLAKKCLQAASADKHAAISKLCQEIARTFDDKWEKHFHNEEHGIFSLAKIHGGEMDIMCEQLRREHDQLRAIKQTMQDGDCSGLKAFGKLLQTHTRKEERELFPLIESSFSEEQLKSYLGKKRV